MCFYAGCSITDEILCLLSPALVRIKMVHLGRNPISQQGWQTFRNSFMDATSVHEAALTHLSLRAAENAPAQSAQQQRHTGSIGSTTTSSVAVSAKLLLHAPGAESLAPMLPRLEEVGNKERWIMY